MKFLSKVGGYLQSNFKIVQSLSLFINPARIAFRFINKDYLTGFTEQEVGRAPAPEKFKLLVVVPPSWSEVNKGWGPGIGHFYYDIWKSAQERYGSKSVEYVELGSDKRDWSEFLLNKVIVSKPSHILFHSEEIPHDDLAQLLKFSQGLNACFSGAFTLLMYDSIFWNHLFIAEAIAEVFAGTSIIATDQFPHLAKVKAKIGPALLPTSLESVNKLDAEYCNVAKHPTYGTTIIGSVYGYRGKKIKSLSRLGLNVEINPHKKINSSTIPSYNDFYAALRNSQFTINFSRANGAVVKHAKTRLLEATLFGTIVATDEKKLTSLLLDESEYIYFRSLRDLRKQINRLNEHEEEYQSMVIRSAAGGARLRSVFWIAFESLSEEFFPQLPAPLKPPT